MESKSRRSDLNEIPSKLGISKTTQFTLGTFAEKTVSESDNFVEVLSSIINSQLMTKEKVFLAFCCGISCKELLIKQYITKNSS